MPSCPIAIPSSMAMVLNSAAKHPSASMSCLTYCPISCRWTCPGTICVNELAMPIMGIPICSLVIPFARHRLLAPAMRRPVVVAALRNWCFIVRILYLLSSIPCTEKAFPRAGERPYIIASVYIHNLSPVICARPRGLG